MPTPRIGWIGTGVMGFAMAGHILDAGFPLCVYTRTMAKAAPLVERGAKAAASPKEVAEQSDIVFSIVGYPKDVEEISLGEQGALQGLKKGGIFCDMTTSSPALAKKIAEAAAQKGILGMDAPVTGGDVGAKNASLSIFVGGAKEGFEKLLPCLQAMGKKILHCGGAGMGQQAKLANQVAIAGVMFSVCESLLFASKAGLDVERWHELVAAGAAGSAAMTNLGPRMIHGDWKPGFFIDHFVKDLGLVLEECRRMGLVLPGTALAEQFYRDMQSQDMGKKGTQALILALARLSNTDWKPIA